MTDNALQLFTEQTILGDDLVDAGGALFPIFQQGAGSNVFRNEDHKELDGCEDIEGVYLAHRFNFIAYAEGYDMKAKEQSEMVYFGACPDGCEATKLVKDACSAYQFTPAADRGKFDFEDSEAGHFKVSLEILIYNAVLDRPIVLRTYNHYKAIYPKNRSLGALSKFKSNGVIAAAPMKFTGTTSDGYGGKDLQWVDVQPSIDESTLQGFMSFVESVTDEDKAELDAWRKAEDLPVSEEVLGYINNVIALKS